MAGSDPVSPYQGKVLKPVLDGNEQVYIASGATVTATTTQNIANLGPVGARTIGAAGVGSNTSIGPLPANGTILFAIFREIAGHAVSVSLGTTSGGSEVMPAVPVPASGVVTAIVGIIIENWFSPSVPQAIFVNSASWGSASINVEIIYAVGP